MALYNVFISHSWTYDEHYQGIRRLLDGQRSAIFQYRDYSVPKNDPVHNAPTDRLLRAAIEQQMRPASVVIILAGLYAHYSKWINIEIEIARNLGKKIIAVEYWGAERTSQIVKNAAHEIVKWNGKSIADAIIRLNNPYRFF